VGTATLRIAVDAADALRGIDAVAARFRRATASMHADAQRASGAQLRSLDQVTQATARSVAQRSQSEARLGAAYRSAAADQARLAEAGARTRVDAERRALGELARLRRQGLAEHERAERAQTRATERERRTRARTVVSAVGAVGGAALGAAQQLHGQRQAARLSRAQAEVGLGGVFRQAGFGVAEARQVRAQFEAAAVRLGVPLEQLSEAAGRAQTEFSVFSARTPEERTRRTGEFLRTAEMARNVAGGESIGEVTRVAGLLQQIGGSYEQQEATLLRLVRLSELGAVELTQVSREAMTPLMARVGQAQGRLGPRATDAERAAAGRTALVRGMAEMEVGRGMAGYNPRTSGNIMANLAGALQANVVQDRLRHNILNAQGVTRARRTEIEGALFENDPTQRGRRRLRQNLEDPLAFIQRSGEVMQNNRAMFANIFAGSGQGNAQALRQNWREFSGALFTAGEGGETGYQRVGRFMSESAGGIDPADMERRRQLAEADPMTQATRLQEMQRKALADNTSALAGLSDRLNAFAMQNPVAATVAGAVLPGLVGAAGRALVGGGLGAGAAGAGAAGAAGGLGVGAATLGVGAGAIIGLGAAHGLDLLSARLGPQATGAAGLSTAGMVTDPGGFAAETGRMVAYWTGADVGAAGGREAQAQERAGVQVEASRAAGDTAARRFGGVLGATGARTGEATSFDLSPATIQALATALQNVTIKATMTPTDEVQAASRAAGQAAGPSSGGG
jgi:hypothetical protein